MNRWRLSGYLFVAEAMPLRIADTIGSAALAVGFCIFAADRFKKSKA